MHPSTAAYTFPRSGRLTISDPHVTPTSVILLQYVDGRGNPREPFLQRIATGQFTARGTPGRTFRYVIFN